MLNIVPLTSSVKNPYTKNDMDAICSPREELGIPAASANTGGSLEAGIHKNTNAVFPPLSDPIRTAASTTPPTV